MLDPADRTVLTEAMRAPPGFRIDHVVATTYTLDLLALLTLPLSFTIAAGDGVKENGRVDPIALLDALRRHVGRMSVFCQAARIATPRRRQMLFSFLEQAVVQVKAPNTGGVFHPKVTIVRYAAEERSHPEDGVDPHAVKYRLLCATRNLTFDASWDTMLVLDGDLDADRQRSIRRNEPLATFVRTLPTLATDTNALDPDRESAIAKIADELLRVDFQVPEGFSQSTEDLVFWPIGLNGKKSWPFGDNIKRMLVISPFVDKACLDRLKKQTNLHAIISRSEELDRLAPAATEQIGACYVLSDAAEQDVPDREPVSATSADADVPLDDGILIEPASAGLRGLHAKLFVADCGWDARLWTGSANATSAAFGSNVEFLVELRGKRSAMGIDALLEQKSTDGPTDKRVRFRDLLVPYTPSQVDPALEELERRLERLIDQVRRLLADAKLVARCNPADELERTFDVQVTSDAVSLRSAFPPNIECSIRPVSLSADAATTLTTGNGALASFGPVAFESLTAFFAVSVTAREGSHARTEEFVLKLPLLGAPEDRDKRLLLAILSSPERLLRYLLMLLDDAVLDTLGAGEASVGRWAWGSTTQFGLPLLEPLLRALAEDPARLDYIERLVQDLEQTDEGKVLLTQEFSALWTAIRTVRSSGTAARKRGAGAER